MSSALPLSYPCIASHFDCLTLNTRHFLDAVLLTRRHVCWSSQPFIRHYNEATSFASNLHVITKEKDALPFGIADHLIHAHLRDAAEVEVLEDVCEEELDELIPNPFYPDPAAAADKDGDSAPVAAAAKGGEAEEDSSEDEDCETEESEEDEDSSEDEDSEENDEEEEGEAEEEVGVGQGWDDEDEWWAEGRFDGEEVEEWVAGQDDE
ncbi:unnamed protein product [Closterium sp. Naga37s-1]|nr:unnamed protein product [Closterium sp. Naga37s-1]